MNFKGKIIIALVVTAIVSVALYFILEATGFKIEQAVWPVTMYMVAKGFSLATLVVLGVVLIRESGVAKQMTLVRLTIIWPFVPLIVRLFVMAPEDNSSLANSRLIAGIIFLIVSLVSYLVLYAMIEFKTAKTNQAVESEEATK